MNALSIFAGACLLFACAMVGLWIKKRLIARAVFYEDYYEYLLFAGEKIGYERMPIHELNTSFADRKKGTFAEYLLHRSIPAQMSSVFANSSGLWLIPSRQGMNSIPVGTRSAQCMASCPAPLGRRI